MARFKLNLGDVFAIPLGDGAYGFGQVITPYEKESGSTMIAIFNYKSDQLKDVILNEVCNSDLVFLGLTFDAKLYHKDWTILGNHLPNVSTIKMPYFKLGTPPDELYLINFKSERLKKIDEELFNKLNYKSTIAPIRYENALKAYFGNQDWKNDEYNKLLYKVSLDSNKIAEDII